MNAVRPAAVAAHVARQQAAEQASADAVIAAVAALHIGDGKRRERCVECGQRVPCRTFRVLTAP